MTTTDRSTDRSGYRHAQSLLHRESYRRYGIDYGTKDGKNPRRQTGGGGRKDAIELP